MPAAALVQPAGIEKTAQHGGPAFAIRGQRAGGADQPYLTNSPLFICAAISQLAVKRPGNRQLTRHWAENGAVQSSERILPASCRVTSRCCQTPGAWSTATQILPPLPYEHAA